MKKILLILFCLPLLFSCGERNKQKEQWSNNEKITFLKYCYEGAQSTIYTESQVEDYCSCSLEKTMLKYNQPTSDIDMQWAKEIQSECRIETRLVAKFDASEYSNDIFVKVDISRREISVGDKIVITYKIFTLLNTEFLYVSQLPVLNGFSQKELTRSNPSPRDVIGGITYNVIEIKKIELTAQKSGELIIDPIKIKCKLVIGDLLGEHNIQEGIIASTPIIVNVL
jgi:hypothetical protein